MTTTKERVADVHAALAEARAHDRLVRLDIAARLGLPVLAITPGDIFDYGVGYMDEGASCALWLRDYRPNEEWPRALPDLLTEGSDAQ